MTVTAPNRKIVSKLHKIALRNPTDLSIGQVDTLTRADAHYLSYVAETALWQEPPNTEMAALVGHIATSRISEFQYNSVGELRTLRSIATHVEVPAPGEHETVAQP